MPRIKNQPEGTIVDQSPDQLNVESTTAETVETIVEEAVKVTDTEKESKVEMPAFVSQVLAKFPQYEELYVDNYGGVFSVDCKLDVVKNAILYKNPYFKP